MHESSNIILSLIRSELLKIYPGKALNIINVINDFFSFKYNLLNLKIIIAVGIYTNNLIRIKSRAECIPINFRIVNNIT